MEVHMSNHIGNQDKKISDIRNPGVTCVTDVTELINRDNSCSTTKDPGVTEATTLINKELLDSTLEKTAANVISQISKPKEVPCFRVYDNELNSEKMPSGVWYFETDNDGNIVKSRVCSPVYVEAVTFDGQENNYGRLLRFKTTAGNWREWAMPMEMLKGSGDELRGELLAMGVEIQPGGKAKNLLSMYLQSNPPKKQIRCALQVGWCGKSFVLPDKVYGEDTHKIIFQSGDINHAEYTQQGTLKDWQAGIASHAIANPMLMIAISSAFAGALLKKTNAESGGLHFVGESSTGKSTCGIAACSVWGGENYKRSWRTTANGLEGAAMLFNDGLLVLDEIGECDPKDVGNIIYALGNGKGKQRASRSGAAREVRSWRCFVLSNGEVTISTRMNEAGQRSRAGQEVRLLDLPVDRKFGIFDELHGFRSGAELSDSIKNEAEINFGVAGRAFLEKLTQDTRNLGEKLGQIKDSSLLKIEGAQGQHRRAAARFALIALAGELATEYGVTGWPEGAATIAAIEGFRIWCSTRGQGNNEKRQILSQVLEFIERYSDGRFSGINDPNNPTIRDRAGWHDTAGLYFFTSGGMREALKGYDFKRSLGVLESVGVLSVSDKEGKRSVQRKINNVNTRVYEINANKLNEVMQ
jgi:putative DNA primase/helicase